MDTKNYECAKEYFKLKARLKKHGDTTTKLKAGRPNKSESEKKRNKAKYYQETVKPKLKAKREEAIKNGTYVPKKRGRPKKE